MGHSPLHEPLLRWYDANARDLPWRRPECSAWGVLVSEIMLQQTPVARVQPMWEAWLARWPTPADLAAATPADVVRAWGRLGYPRRALRLHKAAHLIVERHDGKVPSSYDSLRSLPGIGDYTAAAIATFAFGQRHVVLDTNVRRVLARLTAGEALPAPTTTVAERRRAHALLPDQDHMAGRWTIAVMELGALVCRARTPACETCPVFDCCAWHQAGRPDYAGPPRRVQPFAGTDRQVRGRLMAVLREAREAVPKTDLDLAWPDPEQRDRALTSLIADGLVEPVHPDRYQLPESRATAAT